MRTVMFLLNTCINRKRRYCSHGFREGIELQGMTVASENGSLAEKRTHKKQIRKVRVKVKRTFSHKQSRGRHKPVGTEDICCWYMEADLQCSRLKRQKKIYPEKMKRTPLVNVPCFSGTILLLMSFSNSFR